MNYRGFALALAGGLIATLLSAGPARADGKYSYSRDYTRLAGRLGYEGVEDGFWTIRFIAPDDPTAGRRDKHRGWFVLGNPPALVGYKDGEFVEVTGHISPNQESIYNTGTMYDVRTIRRQAAPAPADERAALRRQIQQMRDKIDVLKLQARRQRADLDRMVQAGAKDDQILQRRLLVDQLEMAIVAQERALTEIQAMLEEAADRERPWQLIAGRTEEYRKTQSEEKTLVGELIEEDLSQPGHFYTRRPVNYYLRPAGGGAKVLLGPPTDATLGPLAGKRVEVRGKLQAIHARNGDPKQWLLVGWVREAAPEPPATQPDREQAAPPATQPDEAGGA